MLNPFELRGTEFLFFHAALIVAAGIAVALLRRLVDTSPASGPEPQLDRYELAHLVGGPRRVALLGIATVVDQQRATLTATNVIVMGSSTLRSHAVERTLLKSSTMTLAEALVALRPVTGDIERTLRAEGLVVTESGAKLVRLTTTLLLVALTVLGVSKIIVGLNRDRPIAFLVILAALALIGGVSMLSARPMRTRHGNAVVRRLRERTPADPDAVRRRGTLAAAASDPSDRQAQLAGMMVAMYGLSALSLHPDHSRLRRSFSGGDSSGGSFSSDGGSGGGSGDGDGGGCGGCGGGD